MRFTVRHMCLFAVIAAISSPTLATIEPLTPEDCQYLAERNTITPENPLACNRLARVTFDYIDFEGTRQTGGEVVVLDVIAEATQNIFEQMLERGFPLQQAVPLETYRGNDRVSMRNNNTSSFNGRKVAGKDSWSKHAYGAAIDLNPLQNPFISFHRNEQDVANGRASVQPKASSEQHVNRLDARPGKPQRPGRAEEVVDLFAENGFLIWGGYWNFPVDYQHFEIAPWGFIKRLARLPLDQGKVEFKGYITAYRQCMALNSVNSHEEHRALCVKKVTDESPI